MQPHPLPRQQVGEHRLAQQRVPEPVAAVAGDDQQVAVHRLGERRLQLAGASPPTADTSSWRTRRPATAATRSTCWAAAERCSTRASSTSVSASGRASPCRPAASSSSA